MEVSYEPAGKPGVIPYLIASDAEKELARAKQVFGAKEMHVSRDERWPDRPRRIGNR